MRMRFALVVATGLLIPAARADPGDTSSAETDYHARAIELLRGGPDVLKSGGPPLLEQCRRAEASDPVLGHVENSLAAQLALHGGGQEWAEFLPVFRRACAIARSEDTLIPALGYVPIATELAAHHRLALGLEPTPEGALDTALTALDDLCVRFKGRPLATDAMWTAYLLLQHKKPTSAEAVLQKITILDPDSVAGSRARGVLWERSALPVGKTLHLPPWKTTAGSTLDPAALARKRVVLYAWASTCSPCKVEILELAALVKTGTDAYSFIGLNYDEHEEDCRKAASDWNAPGPQVWMTSQVKEHQYRFWWFPRLLLVDNGLLVDAQMTVDTLRARIKTR